MRLKPDKNRLNYSEILKPPVGYEVVFAVGTSYSLDLEALIGVPLALGLSEEMDESLKDGPIILEALRRTTDKFALFCEAGQIKLPNQANKVFSLMEDSVFEVALANERSFHPKVWVIKYRNADGVESFRVLVLTRNLTFDRSWDIALALTGEKKAERSEKTKPIADFLSFLTKYCTNQNRSQQMEQLIAELDFVHFDLGKNFLDFEFLPLGIDEYTKEETGVFNPFDQLIVMSPFISKTTLKELNEYRKSDEKNVLITRRSKYRCLAPVEIPRTMSKVN